MSCYAVAINCTTLENHSRENIRAHLIGAFLRNNTPFNVFYMVLDGNDKTICGCCSYYYYNLNGKLNIKAVLVRCVEVLLKLETSSQCLKQFRSLRP